MKSPLFCQKWLKEQDNHPKRAGRSRTGAGREQESPISSCSTLGRMVTGLDGNLTPKEQESRTDPTFHFNPPFFYSKFLKIFQLVYIFMSLYGGPSCSFLLPQKKKLGSGVGEM